jgi:hypothetical protein
MIYRSKTYISDYYLDKFNKVKTEILNEKDEFILGTDIDELVDYYFSANCLTPIEFDTERHGTLDHKKYIKTVRAHERESGYQNEGDLDYEFECIKTTIPIIPNENLEKILSLQSSTFLTSGEPNVNSGYDVIEFSIEIKGYGFQYDNERIASEIDNGKNRIVGWIKRKNDNILKENEQLKKNIKLFIEDRKNKLIKDNQLLDNLTKKVNIPLKMKEDEAVKRIKLSTKPIIRRIKPTPSIVEEYILDENKVEDIISLIDNQGKQFERTPKTYKNLAENDLRDIILVNINSVFDGKATGETFSYKGETDIYLNIDKGNILIFECKIWHGETLYNETINQLLKYLTWRNNFGIIITFVKQKNLSEVLTQMRDIICQHPTYKMGFKQIADTHFLSHHKLEQDEFKNVKIHHLFYNLYSD